MQGVPRLDDNLSAKQVNINDRFMISVISVKVFCLIIETPELH